MKLKDNIKNFLSSPKKKKITITVSVILVLIIVLSLVVSSFSKNKSDKEEINTAKVGFNNIKSVVEASGTIEPIDKYNVISLIKGDILSSNFEEGDVVEKDQVLYNIDTKDVVNNVEKAKLAVERSKNNLELSQKSLNDLNIKAPFCGTVKEMYIREGQTISQGAKVCDIFDSSKMILTIPFNANDAKNIYVGSIADVTLEDTFCNLPGRVKRISSGTVADSNNVSLSYIEIEVINPGGINENDRAVASVNGISCNSAGSFTYNNVKEITAKATGDVVSLNKKKGDKVYENEVIATIKSDSISDNYKNSDLSYKDAKLSLENTYNALDEYTIKAPIKGTIIEKNIKAGDKLDNTMTNTVMCVIADLSTIIFTIEVDERDIKKISLDQRVEITADAIDNKIYEGHVSNININGETNNGVTSYPVEIVVDNPIDLLPGMNVNAKIVVEEKENVLSVPVSALMRGNICYVKDDSIKKNKNKKEHSRIPEGFKEVKVETGINDDNYIEILKGLKENEEVYVKSVSTDTTFSDIMKKMEGMEGMGPMGRPMKKGSAEPRKDDKK